MDKGKLYLVATPIGNLSDITYRAIETLKNVDIILAEDTRKTIKLLNHYEISKQMISFYRHNEDVKLDQVVKILNEGKNLALVSDAGTPAISDPGADLVREAIKNNIQIIPIPGACACIQGLIGSGFDTTKFVFEGFLSINKKQRKLRLNFLKEEERTIIFYEAPHKLRNTLKDIAEYFGMEKEIVLAREITKIHEEYLRFTVAEAIKYYEHVDIKGEFVIIIRGKEKTEEGGVREESIKELMEEYLSTGIDKKEAMKKVAKDKKITKSEVYKELLRGD